MASGSGGATGPTGPGGVVYDVCVVGAGLWGSAAARHASARPGQKVCLVGQTEPAAKQEHDCHGVFSSHYDAGRTVRRYQGTDKTKTKITMRTFESFKKLQTITGFSFYKNTGNLYYGRNTKEQMRVGLPDDTTGIYLKSAEVPHHFPYLDTRRYGEGAVWLPRDAGWVNPRLLVAAQKAAARSQGCDIVESVVESVTESRTAMIVGLASGNTVRAGKVLLCPGVFAGVKRLLPERTVLDLEVDGEFVVLLEVAEEDLERLGKMPTMASSTDPEYNCYILPPIRYPDGKTYIKIGQFGDYYRHMLTTPQAIRDWYYDSPKPELVERFQDILLSIVTDFSPASVHTRQCYCARTPSQLPYCGMVSPRLGIATGGNGLGAMMSDEMGRMAADMIAGAHGWNRDIPAELLRVRYVEPTPTSNL